MSRLLCLGKSSEGSRKQLEADVPTVHVQTNILNECTPKESINLTPESVVRVPITQQGIRLPKSSPNPVLNLIQDFKVGEQAVLTAATDEELKMKDLRDTQLSDSVEIGGTTYAPPPVEPLPMHEVNEEEEQTEAEEADDEDLKAPLELIIEFLSAVIDRDFQLAHRLCQMILIYEPDNPEASEFLPLIQKKLLEEQEEEQSTEEDEEEDDDSDNDDDESGSDEESSQSSQCSPSSSSSSDGEEEETQEGRHKPCPPSHISP